MSNKNKPFGGHIPQADAQRMYLNFYKIKKRSLSLIQQSFTNDNEALRYHGGRYKQPLGAAPGQGYSCSFLDMSFVFDRQSINRLMNPSSGDTPDGIIIFMGARNQEDSVGETTDEAGKVTGTCCTDVDGRPTLLAFPFTYQGGVQPTLDNQYSANLVIAMDDGEEHPGTGGGGGGGGIAYDGGIVGAVGRQPNEATMPIARQISQTYPVGSIQPLDDKTE